MTRQTVKGGPHNSFEIMSGASWIAQKTNCPQNPLLCEWVSSRGGYMGGMWAHLPTTTLASWNWCKSHIGLWRAFPFDLQTCGLRAAGTRRPLGEETWRSSGASLDILYPAISQCPCSGERLQSPKTKKPTMEIKTLQKVNWNHQRIKSWFHSFRGGPKMKCNSGKEQE